MSLRSYRIYGISVRSFLPFLNCRGTSARPAIEITEATAKFSSLHTHVKSARARRYSRDYHALPDGSEYMRFFDFLEIWVSPDGRRVLCSLQGKEWQGSFKETLQNFFQTTVLSFSLIKMGMETLHATGIDVQGAGIGILGESRYGKSTLAASFAKEGFNVFTDDILVAYPKQRQVWTAYGSQRLKLFPKMLRHFFGTADMRAPYRPRARKYIVTDIKKPPKKDVLPVKALFVLNPPTRAAAIRIRKVPAGKAVLALLGSSFNSMNLTPARIAQQFDRLTTLSRLVPVYSLQYPRVLSALKTVQKEILQAIQ